MSRTLKKTGKTALDCGMKNIYKNKEGKLVEFSLFLMASCVKLGNDQRQVMRVYVLTSSTPSLLFGDFLQL